MHSDRQANKKRNGIVPRASGLHAQGDGSSFRLGCNARCESKATLQDDRRMSALAPKAEWGDDHVSSGPCTEMSYTKSLTSLVPIRRDVLAGVNNESRSPEISKKALPTPQPIHPGRPPTTRAAGECRENNNRLTGARGRTLGDRQFLEERRNGARDLNLGEQQPFEILLSIQLKAMVYHRALRGALW